MAAGADQATVAGRALGPSVVCSWVNEEVDAEFCPYHGGGRCLVVKRPTGSQGDGS